MEMTYGRSGRTLPFNAAPPNRRGVAYLNSKLRFCKVTNHPD